MAMATADGVTFDKTYRVRVLDEDKAKQSLELGTECEDFPVKVGRLRSQVKIVVDQVKQQAELLDREKMLAIGVRNQVKAAEENRRRKHAELELDLRARQAELDRLKTTLDSLRQVKQEQEAYIQKLTEAGRR